MLWALLASFGSAIIAAWAWVLFLWRVDKKRKFSAAWWDMVIVGMALVTVQLWGDLGNEPLILVARVLGSGIGTLTVMQWGTRP